MDAICGYCPFSTNFEPLIKHLFEKHPSDVVKYRERVLCHETGKLLLFSKEFNLVPNSFSYENIAIII